MKGIGSGSRSQSEAQVGQADRTQHHGTELDAVSTSRDEEPPKSTLIHYVIRHPYHGYVLLMMTVVYLMNQLDRYIYSPDRPSFVSKHQFSLLSGPLFTVAYTLAGVLIAFFGSQWNRTRVLALALLFWSLATGLTGASQNFTQVAILRIAQGVGEAGCTPFAAGIIGDYFPPEAKGTAMSFYNVGIYTGFSLAQSTGTQIRKRMSWRAAYIIFGAIGGLIALLVWTSVKEPKRASRRAASTSSQRSKSGDAMARPATYREIFFHWIASPSLILLCIAGGVRNAGGYVWAYYVSDFFKKHRDVSDDTYSAYMSVIPLIGGSLGALFGGFISDRLVNRVRADGSKMGPRGRLLVIMVSNLLAAPFSAGALLLTPASPWAFLCLIPANVIGEMWIGVCLAMVMELTPVNMRTTSVAIYLFIITNIGGNASTLVPKLESLFGGKNSLRNALLVLYPGVYAASVVFFLVTLVFINRDIRIAKRKSEAAEASRLNDVVVAGEALSFEDDSDMGRPLLTGGNDDQQ